MSSVNLSDCGPVTAACFERLEHLTKHSHFRKPEFYYWWPLKSEAVDTAMLFPRSVSPRIVGPQESADAGFVREPVRGKLTHRIHELVELHHLNLAYNNYLEIFLRLRHVTQIFRHCRSDVICWVDRFLKNEESIHPAD